MYVTVRLSDLAMPMLLSKLNDWSEGLTPSATYHSLLIAEYAQKLPHYYNHGNQANNN